MKQHVTPKQLAEVSKETVHKLLEVTSTIDRANYFEFHCKKMTVGKMIEQLDANIANIENLNGSWEITLNPSCKTILENELCDVLWEAVKIIV
jgi:hypothetical protein